VHNRSDALTIPAQIVDNQDGSYGVSYRVTRSGDYLIQVGSPLSYSGNPGVNAESHRGGNWKRLG
jgi:hypothetical protein